MSAAHQLPFEVMNTLTVVVDEWSLEKPLPPRHFGMTCCKDCGKIIAAEYSHCDRCDESGNRRFGLPGLNEPRVDKSIPVQALPVSVFVLDITLAEMFDVIDGLRKEVYIRDNHAAFPKINEAFVASKDFNMVRLRARNCEKWEEILCVLESYTKAGNNEVHHNTPDDTKRFYTLHLGRRLEVKP